MNTPPEAHKFSKKPERLRHLFATDAAKQIALVVAAGLVLISALWIWKSTQIRSIMARDAADREQMKKEATSALQQSHEKHLKLLARPFVWAIRNEMLSGKLSQVNLYANDMVRENNVQKIVITDSKGLVVLSTNKQDQGKKFALIGNPAYVLATTTMVNSINDSIMVMSSPIMGFNSRLGTLIVNYVCQPAAF